MTLPDPLRSFAERHLGELSDERECTRSDGESRVWALAGADDRRAHLKVCQRDRKLQREVAFYEGFAPRLGGRTPALLGSEPEHCAILLTTAPGRVFEGFPAPAELERDVHRQAGAFLRDLQAAPYTDTDPVLLIEAIPIRLASWCERTASVLDGDLLAWAVEFYGDRQPFAGAARTPCHRDFRPRNWLVDDHGKLTVIDYSHHHGDLWLVDLVMLVEGPWIGRPELEASFLEGFGRTLTKEERTQLDCLLLLHGLGMVARGNEQEDPALRTAGEACLRRLRERTG